MDNEDHIEEVLHLVGLSTHYKFLFSKTETNEASNDKRLSPHSRFYNN